LTADSQDDDFVFVSLSKISPGRELPSSIFLKINGKYLKYKNEGDILDSDKFNFFMSKNVKGIYIDNSESGKFNTWVGEKKEEVIQEMVDEVGEENRDIVEKRENIAETVFETFSDEHLSTETVELLQEQVEEFIQIVSKKKEATQVLAKITKLSQSVAEHSVNTAQIALYLGMVCGHGHPNVLENIYLGALFHDYAKAKIPANVLENPNNAMYSQAIQDHPKKGVDALKKIGGLQDPVLTIVLQHHEQHNGQGFPKGLKDKEIYELTKIVTIANIVDGVLCEEKNRSEETYEKAIKILEYDRGKQFDPELIPRCTDALRLAFAGYERERES
jgi:HD-GYP domain-containing protein (c-di-GMP phosphodiesterase class II)